MGRGTGAARNCVLLRQVFWTQGIINKLRFKTSFLHSEKLTCGNTHSCLQNVLVLLTGFAYFSDPPSSTGPPVHLYPQRSSQSLTTLKLPWWCHWQLW
jgi:hypothetical protein